MAAVAPEVKTAAYSPASAPKKPSTSFLAARTSSSALTGEGREGKGRGRRKFDQNCDR